MNLTSYPPQIRSQAHTLAAIEANIATLQSQIRRFEADADRNIAFATELKNDHQRKARKDDLLANNPEYMNCLLQLDVLQKQQRTEAIELQFLRDEFLAVRLERQTRIAEMGSVQLLAG